MMRHLPMGWLTGMYISTLSGDGCQVVLKDRWWIHNPFGSVFWAVMSMAAELSAGALVYVYASTSGFQFILVEMEAKFEKKAVGSSVYNCMAGPDEFQMLDSLVQPGDQCIISMPVIAFNKAGDEIASYTFHWQIRKPR